MIFDLVGDFAEVLAALPAGHRYRPTLALLDEAVRRDAHFIARHAHDYPQALFQCLWNSCWWHDCPEAARHHEKPDGDAAGRAPPWEGPGPRLSSLLERWRSEKEMISDACWLRALRPPATSLGSAQRVVLPGHEGGVTGVAFSPDGRLLATGTQHGRARVWDVGRGDERLCLPCQEDGGVSVAFSPDGRLLVTTSDDGTVRAWSVGSGEEVLGPPAESVVGADARVPTRAELPAVARDRYGVDAAVAACSGDGRLLAVCPDDETIRLIDARTGAELRVFRGHEEDSRCVELSPDERLLASGSDDGTVRVWDVQADTGSAWRPIGHRRRVQNWAFSPDGRLLASGSPDETVRVWDATTGLQLHCLGGHDAGVAGVAFTPDGLLLTMAMVDESVRVWDPASGAFLRTSEGESELAAIFDCGFEFPWRGPNRGFDTPIRAPGSPHIIAWLPREMVPLLASGDGKTWACALKRHLDLFTLEGRAGSPV
jgi:WD40 repeat protein